MRMLRLQKRGNTNVSEVKGSFQPSGLKTAIDKQAEQQPVK